MQFINDIKECVTVLQHGGLILYPTDTIWGIGCDATNQKAVEKIYKLKQRANDKSMLGGVQLKFSKLRVYGRYVVGLNDINDIDNKEKWKNQSIQLGVGLAL